MSSVDATDRSDDRPVGPPRREARARVAKVGVLIVLQVLLGWLGGLPLLADGDVTDLVALLIMGGCAFVGLPGSVLTLVADLRFLAGRPAPAAARVALWWSAARLAGLVGVTAAVIAVTDPGPGGEWSIDWELIVAALAEVVAALALARTSVRAALTADQRRVSA